jgi:hypothetical protein
MMRTRSGAFFEFIQHTQKVQKTHQNDGTSFKRKSGKTHNSTNIIAIVTAATPQQ